MARILEGFPDGMTTAAGLWLLPAEGQTVVPLVPEVMGEGRLRLDAEGVRFTSELLGGVVLTKDIFSVDPGRRGGGPPCWVCLGPCWVLGVPFTTFRSENCPFLLNHRGFFFWFPAEVCGAGVQSKFNIMSGSHILLPGQC